MLPILLTPHIKPTCWGGRKLVNYGFILPKDEPIGEAWTCSVHSHGRSGIADSRFPGMDLYDLWQQYPSLLGIPVNAEFPIMIKWIDAQDDLSIQVHPDDQVAQQLEELPNGKTECWYIISADENAEIIFGHHCQSASEFASALADNTLMDKLQYVPVKAGDFIFVPAGAVHALTKGCLVLEVQQNSNATYRLYDYHRYDKITGQPRELHIEKGLIAAHYPHRYWTETTNGVQGSRQTLTFNPYFFVEERRIVGNEWISTSSTFQLLTLIEGQLTIDDHFYTCGATLLLPANEKYFFEGEAKVILTGIPDICKESVRLGIDLGGTQLRVAAIDKDGVIKKQIKCLTANHNGVDFVLANMISLCKALQAEFHVSAIGVAAPGPLDAAQGIIQSPPNLQGWDSIHLRSHLESAFNCPVAVENDANAAALGEAIYGAGQGIDSVFYITISTGIGGGFVYHGQLVGGANSCAGEIGNMIIDIDPGMSNPALNVGALENLASGTALTQRAHMLGFTNASTLLKQPEERCRFVNYLATGIANIIHTLDPHQIILGGGVTASADLYWDELLQAINKRVYPQLRNKTVFSLAKLGGNAGVIGAAALNIP